MWISLTLDKGIVTFGMDSLRYQRSDTSIRPSCLRRKRAFIGDTTNSHCAGCA